jgi:hypothetical protein
MVKNQALDKAMVVAMVPTPEDQEDMAPTLELFTEDMDKVLLAMVKVPILMQVQLHKVSITQVNPYNSNLALELIAIVLLLSHKVDAVAI